MSVIEDRPVLSTVIFAVLLVVLLVGIWTVSSYFEARAYNNATGSNVSTWDAMWVELRIQAGPK